MDLVCSKLRFSVVEIYFPLHHMCFVFFFESSLIVRMTS
jgi:hypothetical protein